MSSIVRRVFFPVLFAFVYALAGTAPAHASKCIAFAKAEPRVQLASFNLAALAKDEVRITFVGHSSFRIETPEGVSVVTDYAGAMGGTIPHVVTMNHAHETHYTDFPDPDIVHVLRGWNPEGGPAKHELRYKDIYIRNVPTDIRTWSGIRETDGNSIFIFEVADMCIGHLGHLHHDLGPEHLALIGQLDIVMVPIDGSFTMAQDAMIEVLKQLKARLILPMHAFGQFTFEGFLARMGEEFEVARHPGPEIVVSQRTLPRKPKVLSLLGY